MFRRPDRIIVPQYAAPKGVSLLAAAELIGEGKRAIAAQIVELAVRKALAISPVDAERKKKTGFRMTLVSLAGLAPDELDTMQALFPRGQVGESILIRPGRNEALSRRLRNPHGRAVARLVVAGAARERTFFERTFSRGAAQPIVPLPAAYPVIDHLWGIRDYIALAEKDRLAFLQSPSGALLRPDISVNVQALVLNEKLLSWAVLFGLEKEWVRELGVQVQQLDAESLADLELLGDVIFVLADPAMIDTLFLLGDLAQLLFGMGRVVGGILRFVIGLSN